MKRIAILLTGLTALALAAVACGQKDEAYSIVILGDTHYDTEPDSVYHSHYNEPVEWLNRVQRAEFARNGEMWRERCPKLLRRAARLITPDTKMVFQMGDLIQGDCGSAEVHKKMLDDVMNDFKQVLGGLPFVTVVGNHDVRGKENGVNVARQAYHEYMPARMSQELGKEITKTTFGFTIGPDAFIVVDFDRPDDAETDRLLAETEGARYTFIIIHGPVFPYDGGNCRWIYHGKNKPEETAARLHFREAFAKRGAIVLCGHTHKTEFLDWEGDGGRITQMTMNSVYKNEEVGKYVVQAEGAGMYGELRKGTVKDDGTPVADETAFFDEYRSGIRSYSVSPAAGSYKMKVSKQHVTIDFYAGDSQEISQSFILR